VAQYKASFISLLNQRAGKVVITDRDALDNDYLYYVLSTQEVRQAIALMAHGAANQANVSPKDIEKLKLNVLPRAEQVKIGQLLSAYDHLIENNKRRIELLEKLAEEIYREWFVRLRFPGYQKINFVKARPATWVPTRLGEIAILIMGQSPPSATYNQLGHGLPFHQGVGTYEDRFPKKVVFCTANGRRARKGDVLFSVRAPVGRLNIADSEMVIGRGLAAIRHKQGHNSYLYYLLKVVFADEDIIGNGSIFNSVGKDELARFEILQPDEQLIKSFETQAARIDEQIAILTQSVECLIKARDLLLPRLISGKLSVENLDIQFPPGMMEELDHPPTLTHHA
jgi:type I restriction enzyme S subunit